MSKCANKSPTTFALRAPAAALPKAAKAPKSNKTDPSSKQSRIVALLSSPDGTTIAAMMKATGWQQHSVRGFLAGVVRKKLKLNLNSEKIDGSRFYRIKGADGNNASARQSKRRAT